MRKEGTMIGMGRGTDGSKDNGQNGTDSKEQGITRVPLLGISCPLSNISYNLTNTKDNAKYPL